MVLSGGLIEAQQQADVEISIPNVMKFTGSLPGLQDPGRSSPVNVRFALYREETGGVPLWSETQNVSVDTHGRFTVLLGSSSPGGIPLQVFAIGEARWLGVSTEDAAENARTKLASVPYAFKAADADTIGGRTASEFVTPEQLRLYLSQAPVSTIGSAGQTPEPAGLSINADGTINFAPGQQFPGNTRLPYLGVRGGPAQSGGAEAKGLSGWLPGLGPSQGSVVQSLMNKHNMIKPLEMNSSGKNYSTLRVLLPSDNWTLAAVPTELMGGVQAALTLSPCPIGVDTSGSPSLGGPKGGYPVYIADAAIPTNSESVYVSGGTCKSATASGTIIFTPYFSHSAGTYSVGSASSGIQEMINEACGTNVVSYRNGGCKVTIPATGPQSVGYSGYNIYDTIYFHATESLLSGYGAILNCRGRGPCLQVGDLTGSNDYVDNSVEGISFRSLDDHRSDAAFNGSLIESTQRTGGTITVQTTAPHNFRTGDRVTQMLTDTSNYWGDVPSITVIDATHYSYSRANTTDLLFQTTPGVVALSYEAVLDNAGSTGLMDLLYESTYEYGAFNHFFDFWDDENAQVSRFSNNAIGLNQNSNWTGSFVWSGGALTLPNKSQQLAPVITVDNSSFTANGSNCATIYNSNEFFFQNSVCQAQGAWEFLISDTNGNYQGAAFTNIYSESSLSTNPANPARSPWPGLGSAGLIGGPLSLVGTYTLSGEGGFSGSLPTIGSGSTTYVYYVVARDLTAGTQTSPLPVMYEQENSSSQVAVKWPRLAGETDTIVYDLLRNPAPQGTMNAAGGGYIAPYEGGCNGGTASACGFVALGLAQCSGFVCSYEDNTANATSAYSIKNGNFAPNPTFWPGTAVLSNNPLQSFGGELPVTGIAFDGAPTLYADYCSNYGDNVSGGYTVCAGSITTPNNAVPDQAPLMLTDGGAAGGGGTPGAKGRLIFETTANSNAAYHQVITVYDSNPEKTQATTGHRPVGDPGDMYLGIDPNKYLMIGGGTNGIAQYINNIGDGSNWEELLTSALKTFKVAVQAPTINVSTGVQINGNYGLPGQCLISTGNGSTWGACGGSLDRDRYPENENTPSAGTHRSAGNGQTTSGFSPVGANTFSGENLNGNLLPCGDGRNCIPTAKNDSDNGSALQEIAGSVPFSVIPNGRCADGNFRWNGVTASNPLIGSWPAKLSSGLIGNFYVSSPGTITVRLCNFSGEAITPGRLQVKAALEPHRLSGAGPLTFSAIKNGTCNDQTFPLKGVASGDPLIPKWPSTMAAGLIGFMRAETDNTVEVRLCNFSGMVRTVANQEFGAFITK